REGVVYHAAGDGKTAPIDPRDLAEVAVQALTSPGHQGQAYTLTGPEALSVPEQVERLGVAIGKPLRCPAISEAAAHAAMLQAGVAEAMVGPLLELVALIRAGYTGAVSPTLEQLLGRPARRFAEWARDHAAAFR